MRQLKKDIADLIIAQIDYAFTNNNLQRSTVGYFFPSENVHQLTPVSITNKELDQIRSLIKENPQFHRAKLSREVCQTLPLSWLYTFTWSTASLLVLLQMVKFLH